MDSPDSLPTWLKVIAAGLDFLTIFIAGGFLIARLTGQSTEHGFKLSGMPALLLMVVVVAYFWLLPKVTGVTLWAWIFGARG